MSFVLLREILNCSEYRPMQGERGGERCLVKVNASGSGTEPVSEETLAAAAVIDAYFTPELISHIVNAIVTKYLVLTESDMERWSDEPEETALEEVGDGWTLNTKACAENALHMILTHYKDFVGPLLVEMLKETADLSTFQGILARDAVYSALGKGAYELFDYLDFSQCFQSILLPELATQGENMQILHRRILWMIERWIPVKLAKELRAVLFEALTSVLESSTDTVVRLSAVKTLGAAVSDFDFRTEDFLPVMSRLFG